MENHIRSLRLQFSMTQEQLAEMVGVSRQSVIAIEAQRYNPSLELAFKIARAFNMTIEEVFIFGEGAN